MHCIECICIGTGIFYYLCAQRSLQNQKFPAVTIKINFLAYGDFGPHGLQAIFGYLILYANCHLSTIDVNVIFCQKIFGALFSVGWHSIQLFVYQF